jgi:two-component system, LytTR family, sensor kinase
MNATKYHIYAWTAFVGLHLLLDFLQYKGKAPVTDTLYLLFIQAFTFYCCLWALARLKKGGKGAGAIVGGLFVLSFGLVWLLNHWRGKWAAYNGMPLFDSLGACLTDTVRIFGGMALCAIGYHCLARHAARQQRQRQEAERKAAADMADAAQRYELLEMQNNFLREQVNAHFLYNTLNMFYAKALPTNQELAGGLLAMANIMRYAMHATQGGKLVPLEMEVAHLERVIGLHRLRFGNHLPIQFTVEGQHEKIGVAPLIFVTLLEHALQRGRAESPVYPIVLKLAVDEERLCFDIRNKKNTGINDRSQGIGLHGIKKRLATVYGSHHRLNIVDTAAEYHVALVIEHTAAAARPAVKI